MPREAMNQNVNQGNADEELRSLLRRVRLVELKTRKAVNAHAQGAYQSRFKGRGMAFSESRAYVPGDDPRHVDWNVTARSGELYVKQFVEERELVLLLAVDLSGSLSFGSKAQQKRQLAAEAAALMAFSALRNHDKVGLLLFTDQVERLIVPKSGRSHVLRLLREILVCQPAHRGTDLAKALRQVSLLSNKRAIVAVISDFMEPGALSAGTKGGQASAMVHPAGKSDYVGIEKPMRVLSRRHDLLLFEVEDPLERDLPDVGLLAVRDAETGQETLVDTSEPSVREAYREWMERDRSGLRAKMAQLGAEHVTLRTGDDASRALIRFLQRRARRGR